MQDKEIIFGAPGCGKTTYLLGVLEKELQEHDPDRIAFVSFTKKGVAEGLNRAMEQFGFDEKDLPFFRTIHSICFRALGMSRYDMLSKKDYKLFSSAMNMKFVGYYTEEFYHNDDRYLFLYFLKQHNYEMYVKTRDALQQNIVKLKHIATNYANFKKHFYKFDFTDMLTQVIDQKIELDIDVAIIDESQDLTTLQWQVCNQLFGKAKKIYIAGDDDQAIYEWTGADVNYFLDVKGKRTILDKSWRLKTNILNFSKKITAMIDHRVDKQFDPHEDGGNIYYHNELDGFKFEPKETYYCLARNNYYLKRYRDELRDQGKVFIDKHNLSIDPRIIYAIDHFEEYKEGLLDEQQSVRVSRWIRNDVGNIKNLYWYDALNIETSIGFYYRQLIKEKAKLTDPLITVNTIHGVKGGEADNVLLFMDVTRAVYKQLYDFADSELRCLYVACTRAKQNLHIIYEKTKFSYANIFKELRE